MPSAGKTWLLLTLGPASAGLALVLISGFRDVASPRYVLSLLGFGRQSSVGS